MTMKAVHYEKPIEKTTVLKFKKENKKPVKSFFEKSDDKNISKNAIAALIIGCLAFFCMVSPLIGIGLWIWFIAAILATIGDILAIKALRRIKNSENKEDYKLEKRLARVGLILSLLTGLIPLAMLILVLLAG